MIKNRSIYYTFMKAFTLLIMIPFLLFVILFYQIYSTSLINSSITQAVEPLNQLSSSVNRELKRAMMMISTINNANGQINNANGQMITETVTKWHQTDSADNKVDLARNIDSSLNYLFNYSNEIESVIFYMKDGGHYYYKNSSVVPEADVRSSKWYQDALLNHQGNAVVANTLRGVTLNQKDMFTILLSPKPSLNNDVEMIYLMMHTNLFEIFQSKEKLERFIVDQNGQLIFKDDIESASKMSQLAVIQDVARQQLNKPYFSVELDGQKKIVKMYPLEKTDWFIVNILDEKQITKDADRFLLITLVVSFGIFLLFILFLRWLFTGILGPVSRLIMAMKQVEQGKLEVSIEPRGIGELKRLGHSFNRMVYEINYLIKERDAKERARSQAELDALQSQINPHFLANTLSSIRIMAMIAKSDNIRKVIESLSRMLSHVFRAPGELAVIKQEIQVLEDYVYIMKVRYGGTFEVKFDIDEALYEYRMLKMLLQPILENSIFHGLNQEGNGMIEVKGTLLEDGIRFVITDNGIGMTEEQIHTLLDHNGGQEYNTRFSGMGIANVMKRIALNYGEPYGISIESEVGGYTKVMLWLPKLKR